MNFVGKLLQPKNLQQIFNIVVVIVVFVVVVHLPLGIMGVRGIVIAIESMHCSAPQTSKDVLEASKNAENCPILAHLERPYLGSSNIAKLQISNFPLD